MLRPREETERFRYAAGNFDLHGFAQADDGNGTNPTLSRALVCHQWSSDTSSATI